MSRSAETLIPDNSPASQLLCRLLAQRADHDAEWWPTALREAASALGVPCAALVQGAKGRWTVRFQHGCQLSQLPTDWLSEVLDQQGPGSLPAKTDGRFWSGTPLRRDSQDGELLLVQGKKVEEPVLVATAAALALVEDTRESIATYSQRISDQVGNVLTAELAKNQVLNNNLMATQAAAQDALKLSHEITALYLSSFKDQGLITRLLTLPANVVRDAASLSIVSSSDRKKVEQELMTKMADIDRKLAEIQAQAPKK
jgi:hypothetical protein